MKISYHSLSKKYLRKIASNIDMNIVHAYPIQNEEFLLRFSHSTNYLDRYVASKTGKYKRYPKREFLLTTLFYFPEIFFRQRMIAT
jgi:hypothetical protein